MSGEFSAEERRKLDAWEAPAVPDGFLDRVVGARAHEVAQDVAPEVRSGVGAWRALAVAATVALVAAGVLLATGAPDSTVPPFETPMVIVPTHPAVEAAWVTVETARLEAEDARTPPVPVVHPTEETQDEIPPMIIGE